MNKYTLESLKSMTAEERATLYQNAIKRRDNGGQYIIDLIDESGLSLSSGGMRIDDPLYLQMRDQIWSIEGRAAAIKSIESGLPALAGIEPLIVAAVGSRYHPHDGGTLNAGYLVAEWMRHLGFVEDGQGKMPEGSVAKTAMKWKRR
jgi:hypothetical protein